MPLYCPVDRQRIGDAEVYHRCTICRLNYHLRCRCPRHPDARMELVDPSVRPTRLATHGPAITQDDRLRIQSHAAPQRTGASRLVWLIVAVVLVIAIFNVVQYLAGSNGSPLAPDFDYPTDAQTLDFNGSWLFKVEPINGAIGYRWDFAQDGTVLWDNLQRQGHLSGRAYSIWAGTSVHSLFHPGDMQIEVEAELPGQTRWSNAASITVHLQ